MLAAFSRVARSRKSPAHPTSVPATKNGLRLEVDGRIVPNSAQFAQADATCCQVLNEMSACLQAAVSPYVRDRPAALRRTRSRARVRKVQSNSANVLYQPS